MGKFIWAVNILVHCFEGKAVKLIALFGGGALIAGTMFSSAGAAIVQNGDFSGGVYTDGGNTSVPNDWAPNSAYVSYPANNFVNGNSEFYNGSCCSLSLSNTAAETAGAVSQTLSDTLGQPYEVSFDVLFRGGAADNTYVSAYVGAAGVTVDWTSAINNMTWYSESFAFTGQGSGLDSLVLSGVDNPSNVYIADVSVSAITATPLPAALPLFAGGLGLMGLVARRRKARAIAA